MSLMEGYSTVLLSLRVYFGNTCSFLIILFLLFRVLLSATLSGSIALSFLTESDLYHICADIHFFGTDVMERLANVVNLPGMRMVQLFCGRSSKLQNLCGLRNLWICSVPSHRCPLKIPIARLLGTTI